MLVVCLCCVEVFCFVIFLLFFFFKQKTAYEMLRSLVGSRAPVVRTHRVAAASRFTIDLSLDVGPGRDVATFIHSTLPVVAERPMYFIYQGKWDGGDDSLGATRPPCGC